MADPRRFDVVVFGATRFTGRRAAQHLAAHAPNDLQWAIAGRDRQSLERLGLDVPILVADVMDATALAAVVSSTRVVLNMAGPFRRLGDPIVAACIEYGTHYCDISGETGRIRDLIDRENDAAHRAGVKIVCFAGASSAPADLAVLLLCEDLGESPGEVTATVRLRSGLFNGGTLSSMSDAVTTGDAGRERDPFLLGPTDRRPTAREQDPSGLRWDQAQRAWLTRSPLGISDTRAIRLSCALRGTDIDIQEYLAVDGPAGIVQAALVRAALGSVAVVLRTRLGRSLLPRIVPPGQGPSEQQVSNGSYSLEVTGTANNGRRGRVTTQFDGDPGNYVTALCAAEIALGLSGDDVRTPDRAGVLTPSIALGSALADRLVAAGMQLTRTGSA